MQKWATRLESVKEFLAIVDRDSPVAAEDGESPELQDNAQPQIPESAVRTTAYQEEEQHTMQGGMQEYAEVRNAMTIRAVEGSDADAEEDFQYPGNSEALGEIYEKGDEPQDAPTRPRKRVRVMSPVKSPEPSS